MESMQPGINDKDKSSPNFQIPMSSNHAPYIQPHFPHPFPPHRIPIMPSPQMLYHMQMYEKARMTVLCSLNGKNNFHHQTPSLSSSHQMYQNNLESPN